MRYLLVVILLVISTTAYSQVVRISDDIYLVSDERDNAKMITRNELQQMKDAKEAEIEARRLVEQQNEIKKQEEISEIDTAMNAKVFRPEVNMEYSGGAGINW